ncbi:Winged helix-like DNA-binding domain superfamily [Sesbania bispinosa]|nr:Winged helix-like DNA-binding domain superfamily [Sesbania bispinosa]
MEVTKDPNSNPADSDSELELYTIPSSSKWFVWDEIHETERTSFKEFFDGSSISRTPKIYKEYRDFMINKYREEPSRRLTFTEVRKSLVGDVTFLRKVFLCLEGWGLINYGSACSTIVSKYLALESVLKHGDDWDLVAQSVQTKTKLECISKLIELPFGELMLGAHRNSNGNSANGTMNNAKQVQSSSSDHQETSKTQDQSPELTNENEQNGDAVKENPSKRQRIAALSDSSSSLLNQVGLISAVVDPHITAAAADAAITALCDENLCPREIFDVEEDYAPSANSLNSDSARALEGEGLEMERSTQSEIYERCPKDDMPLTLRIRAAVATALGAAAARAKLLADQEDREIEHLVATIIEAQIEKLQHKVKHFDDLELLMEKEHAEMEELKDSILTERIDVLRRTFRSGITRWKDYSFAKS